MFYMVPKTIFTFFLMSSTFLFVSCTAIRCTESNDATIVAYLCDENISVDAKESMIQYLDRKEQYHILSQVLHKRKVTDSITLSIVVSLGKSNDLIYREVLIEYLKDITVSETYIPGEFMAVLVRTISSEHWAVGSKNSVDEE